MQLIIINYVFEYCQQMQVLKKLGQVNWLSLFVIVSSNLKKNLQDHGET
jgi:hypothetical protein